MEPLEVLTKRIDYAFSNPDYLQTALTHRSAKSNNNERMEFLGDATLDFVTAEYLYNRFPEMREGQLTSLRSALVRTEKLAQFAAQIQLGRYLNMGKGEEDSPRDLCG